MNCTLEKAAKLLCENDNFIFLCHIRPDGDTVGSAYALKYALEAVGKRAIVMCADEIPARLRFITELSGAKKVLTAAALTYVAALVTSIMQILYYASRFRPRD